MTTNYTFDREQVSTSSVFNDGSRTPENKNVNNITPPPAPITTTTTLSNTRKTAPRCLRCFEYIFRTKNLQNEHIGEATGWTMDAAAKGVLNIGWAYVGNAVILLASRQAGCPLGDAGGGCTNKVYGVRPSSLMALANSVATVASAISMPIIGALIDHSHHRKMIGEVTAALLVVLTLSLIMISFHTWLAVLILDTINSYVMLLHVCTVLSYLSDLSRDQEQQAAFNSRFNMIQLSSMSAFLSIMIVITYFNPNKVIINVRVAQLISGSWAAWCFGYAWMFLFKERPPLRQVDRNSNILLSGFRQNFRTIKKIFSNYNGLRWFLISLLFVPEQGSGSLLSILVTYMTVELKMNITEIGIATLVLLVMSIPGSMLSKFCCQRMNALRSYQFAMAALGATFGLGAGILTGPEKKHFMYLCSAFSGIGFGWIYPSERVILCTISPPGQEAEIMGVFTFFAHLLGWAPTLLFSAINEAGYTMRLGLLSTSFFFVISIICTCFTGSYKKAVEQVQTNLEDIELEERT